jgi:hypothetical protein
MKHSLQKVIFSFFIAALISTTLSAQGWWFRKADFNQSARTAAIGFSIGTAGFIGTGYDSSAYKRNFSLYDQGTDSWIPVTSMGGATGSGLSRDAASSFTIGTKGYVGLGQNSNPYNLDFWEYDAGADIWTQKANFAGSPRRSAIGFSMNSKGYIACGQDISGFKNDLWMYDPGTNSWTSKAAYPGTARRLPVAFVIGTKAFVGTGDDGTFKSDFFKYDATSNAWFTVAPFAGTPRYGACCFVIGTDAYMGTGYDNTLSNRKDFWKYNSLTNTWSTVKDFSGTARSNAVGFAIGSFGYVGTGYDSLTTKDFWLFDPNSNGVEELNKFKYSVNIFPNPMVDNATISFDPESLNAFNKISFIMYDINGREVKHIDRIESSETQIGRDYLGNGIYIYQFIGDNIPLASGKMILE